MRNQAVLKTGDICTMSGIWRSDDPSRTAIRILKGSIMPKFRDKLVAWTMIQHLPR